MHGSQHFNAPLENFKFPPKIWSRETIFWMKIFNFWQFQISENFFFESNWVPRLVAEKHLADGHLDYSSLTMTTFCRRFFMHRVCRPNVFRPNVFRPKAVEPPIGLETQRA